jgi:hypothetical protein
MCLRLPPPLVIVHRVLLALKRGRSSSSSNSSSRSRSWPPRSTCSWRSSRCSAGCRDACRCRASRSIRPLEGSDFRLTLRQTADILLRFEALERPDYERIVALAREGNALEPLVSAWYAATSGVEPGTDTKNRPETDAPAGLDQVLVLALRPFLARCAESLTPQVDLASWNHGHCPICGWEADFAVITPGADRRLFCGRCVAQWAFAPLTCPFCANDDRALITSFATRDGRYRVYACDVCRRYLKAYDARHAQRPVMVAVDTIATLPLDAAAMQRGYTG